MKSIALAPFVGLIVFGCSAQPKSAQQAYDEQLAAAKANGIPTSVAEFESLLPQPKPEDNAGPLYSEITKNRALIPDINEVDKLHKQISNPQTLDKQAARSLLAKWEHGLDRLDKASQKPSCNFQRDWSLGPAVIRPEFAILKNGVRLLTIRAALSASQGDHNSAAQDLLETTRIANHISLEPVTISRRAAITCQIIGANACAKFAAAYPGEAVYRETLAKMIELWPLRDPQQELANDFVELRVAMDGAEDKDFIVNKLGLPESEFSGPLATSTPSLRIQAKANLIEAHIELVKAIGLPEGNADNSFKLGYINRGHAFKAFPVMASIYEGLYGMTEPTTAGRHDGPADKLLFTGTLRALESRESTGEFPAEVDVSDLVIPFVEQPIEYKSLGKGFVISAPIPQKTSYKFGDVSGST